MEDTTHTFTFTFNSFDEANFVQKQLLMTNARGYILDKTERFEKSFDEFAMSLYIEETKKK